MRQVHVSPEIVKTNIDHATRQQVADYEMANTLTKTFLCREQQINIQINGNLIKNKAFLTEEDVNLFVYNQTTRITDDIGTLTPAVPRITA